MFEQADCLLFHQLGNHVTKNGAHSIKPLISLTDVGESSVIQQNLLHDEDGHGLAQLRSSLHDAQAERNDLRGQQEVDNLSRVILHQSPNDAKTSQPKILERTRLRRRIQKWVQEEGDVG
jgi:hypothetical protein